MRRQLAALMGTVALGAGALSAVSRVDAPAPGDQDRPAFRAGATVVAVDVAVRRGDRPLTGLTAGDFEVFDNGVRQAVVDFSYEKLPIDVTIALDVSGSVDGPLLDRLQRAVLQVRASLGAADRLKLLTFNHRVRRIADFADPAAAVDAAFAEIRAGGGSAILDTLALALITPVGPDRRHMVVLFSDGIDTSSINDPGVVLDVVRRTTPVVHVVLATSVNRSSGDDAFTAGGSVQVRLTPAQAARQQLFSLLANYTGGVLFTIAPSENLGLAFRRALDWFRSSYVLHFAPQGVEERGVHRLEVQVKRTGVDVRARREYVWRQTR